MQDINKMVLKKEDFEEILREYSLGNLKSFKRLERPHGSRPCYVIITSKGKYFLKYFLKDPGENLKASFKLLSFLEKKRFPSLKVLKSKSKRSYIEYNGKILTIFELLKLKNKRKISNKEANSLGKCLGKLHNLTKYYKFSEKGQNLEKFSKMFRQNYYKTKNDPKEIKEQISFLKEFYKNYKIPKDQPMAVCHIELTLEHSQYKKGKLVKIFDWDEVIKDFLINDIGTTMTVAMSNEKINFSILRNVIKGYISERKLTGWEKEYLYEALIFGRSKFVIWGLDERNKNYYKTLINIGNLMKMGKGKFYEKLGKI